MLVITTTQLTALQRAQAEVMAFKIGKHLKRQGIDTSRLSPPDLLSFVNFALDCALTIELHIAQLVIFYVTADRRPSQQDHRLLVRGDVPWHVRLYDLTGIPFSKEQLDG